MSIIDGREKNFYEVWRYEVWGEGDSTDNLVDTEGEVHGDWWINDRTCISRCEILPLEGWDIEDLLTPFGACKKDGYYFGEDWNGNMVVFKGNGIPIGEWQFVGCRIPKRDDYE